MSDTTDETGGVAVVANARLVLDEVALRKLRTLVGQSIDGAVRAANARAREIRRGDGLAS